jgi:hypothetical protein
LNRAFHIRLRYTLPVASGFPGCIFVPAGASLSWNFRSRT